MGGESKEGEEKNQSELGDESEQSEEKVQRDENSVDFREEGGHRTRKRCSRTLIGHG